jgi:hypothetical protein
MAATAFLGLGSSMARSSSLIDLGRRCCALADHDKWRPNWRRLIVVKLKRLLAVGLDHGWRGAANGMRERSPP